MTSHCAAFHDFHDLCPFLSPGHLYETREIDGGSFPFVMPERIAIYNLVAMMSLETRRFRKMLDTELLIDLN